MGIVHYFFRHLARETVNFAFYCASIDCGCVTVWRWFIKTIGAAFIWLFFLFGKLSLQEKEDEEEEEEKEATIIEKRREEKIKNFVSSFQGWRQRLLVPDSRYLALVNCHIISVTSMKALIIIIISSLCSYSSLLTVWVEISNKKHLFIRRVNILEAFCFIGGGFLSVE